MVLPAHDDGPALQACCPQSQLPSAHELADKGELAAVSQSQLVIGEPIAEVNLDSRLGVGCDSDLTAPEALTANHERVCVPTCQLQPPLLSLVKFSLKPWALQL